MKLSKEYAEEYKALCARLATGRSVLNEAVQRYNDEVESAHFQLRKEFESWNELSAQAESFLGNIVDEIDQLYQEKEAQWMDKNPDPGSNDYFSDTPEAQALCGWMEAFDMASTDFEKIIADEPDEIEGLDESFLDDFYGLPMEAPQLEEEE